MHMQDLSNIFSAFGPLSSVRVIMSRDPAVKDNYAYVNFVNRSDGVYVCMYVCVRVCMCVHVSVCACVSVCMYVSL